MPFGTNDDLVASERAFGVGDDPVDTQQFGQGDVLVAPPFDPAKPFTPELDYAALQKSFAGIPPPGLSPWGPTSDLAEGLREVVNRPGELPAALLGVATVPGKIAYALAADLTALGQMATDQLTGLPGKPEYGGNLIGPRYLTAVPGELPVDRFLAQTAAAVPAATTAAKVAKGVTEAAPLMATGMLPSWAGRLVAAGFAADMLAHAPAQFEQYAAEINKPPAEQDPDKVTSLQSEILQTFAFAPLLTAHAVNPSGSLAAKLPKPLTAPLSPRAFLDALRPAPAAKAAPQYTPPPPRAPEPPKPIVVIGEAPKAGEVRVTDDMTRPQIEAAETQARDQIAQAWEQMTAAERIAAERGKGLPERFGGRALDLPETSASVVPEEPPPAEPPAAPPTIVAALPSGRSDEGAGQTSRTRTEPPDEVKPQPAVPTEDVPTLPGTEETPAEATAKVADHVAEVVDTEGPRPAKAVKAELIAELQKQIQKLGPEPQLLYTEIKKSPGSREFAIYSPDRTKVVRLRETRLGWELSGEQPNAKTGEPERINLGTAWGDIAKARVAGESAMQKLLLGKKAAKPIKVEIPGDGSFTIERTHAALGEVLRRASAIDTRSTGRPKTIKTGERSLYKTFTEEEWADPAIVGRLENLIKQLADRTDSDSQRRMYEEALRQVRLMHEPMQEQASPLYRENASPPALGGGELGERPPPPEDNPAFSVIEQSPMELPEAVQWVKALTGLYPKIQERLRALGGRAAGVFAHTDGPTGKGSVALRASIFDLLTPDEKAALRTQAEQYARFEAPNGKRAQEQIAREKYADLLERAYEEAKTRNPMQALKVIWHEIGHVVDWLPERMIDGRGNILGRLASLKNFLKHVLPFDPTKPSGKPIRPADKARLQKEAVEQLRRELGPIEEIVRTIIVEEPEFRITGITVEDVKNILREHAGRDTPELTRWFSEQADKTKAEILRKAMRGILDERLAALGKAEQIGTRRTERTVREKVGREPTQAEIKQRFAELLQKEMRARNLADLETIKGELEPLIAWWRGTEVMEDYFRPPAEMYAEAFSAFANNPAAVAKRAPTYYRLIHNYLDRKPEVKAVYDSIQADLRAGTLMPKRVKGLYEMWDGDDARSLDTARYADKVNARDFFDNIAYRFDRTSGPIYRTARGYAREGQLRDARANYLYRATEHERFLAALNRRVGGMLTAANLDWSHDLGEYLFHKRIIEERFNLANPLGWTSKNSLERLGEMEKQLGPERWRSLESAAAEWHRLYNEFVRDPVIQSGMFSPELNQTLLDRAHYATFSAVKGMADNGIEEMIRTQYGQNITPHIYRQIGNLGEIKNPATATVLKGLSLISAIYRNDMKRETVRMMQAQDPDNITPAKLRFDGRKRVPVMVDGPKVGTIVYLENGQPQAFYTRKVIADSVNNDGPRYNQLASAAMHATGLLKGLFTQYNPGFWLFNFARDTMGFTLQMPGLGTPLAWARNLPAAWSAARSSVKGLPNPIAEEALRRKMLISRGDPRGTWAAVNNEYELKVASYGFDPAQWDREVTAVDKVVKAWNWYRELGQTIERVNKIGGMLYLDQRFPYLPEWKKREIVRERSGSPNFLERGANNPAVDLFWLFYNPWKEGVRAIVKSARENPLSFSAKAGAMIALPTVLQAAAYNGWLGDDLKRRMRSIPLYHLSNYLIPYAGWVDERQGKVAAVRLPLFEPARILHGILFQALTGQGEGILSHAGGQLPGLNPLLNVAQQWTAYMMGHNPADIARGVNVLTDQQQAARGGAFGRPGEVLNAEALQQMLQQTWNNLGGTMLYRFRNLNLEQPPELASEKWLGAPVVANMLGRWVLVTSKGQEDQARLAAAPVAQREAEIALGLQPIVAKFVAALSAGRPNPWADLSPAELQYLRDPAVINYLGTRGQTLNRTIGEALAAQSNPTIRQLGIGRSAAQKTAILTAPGAQSSTNRLLRALQPR